MQENVLTRQVFNNQKVKTFSFVSLNLSHLESDPFPLLFSNMLAFVPTLSDYILFAVLIFLIILNAVISGSEIAFFSISDSETDDLHASTEPKKIRVSKLLSKPEVLLASIVMAYNFLNITITAIIIYLLNKLPFFMGEITEGLVLEVIIVVAILLIFVEILPKIYAKSNAMRFAENNVLTIKLINAVMTPFSTLLAKSTQIFSKSSIQRKHDFSMEDLSKALEITSNEITHEQEKDMLEGIIRFKDKTVDDVFVTRIDMTALNLDTSFNEVIKFIINAGFSRIPVFEGNVDNIKGILYVKDLLRHLGKPDTFRWQSLIRPAYFVPGTKRIDDLLEEFRANKNHMAIVVDEYGGTSGLVTMEDILEEIVGDISDEYDEETQLYTIAPDGSYIFEGKTSLEDFIKITDVPENDFQKFTEEVDTVAGMMLELKGDFPKRKEIIHYKKYTFQAEEMNKRRILKVRYIPPKDKHEVSKQ